MKGFSSEGLDALFRRLRNHLDQLLSRRLGRHLPDKYERDAGELRDAMRKYEGAEEHGYREVAKAGEGLTSAERRAYADVVGDRAVSDAVPAFRNGSNKGQPPPAAPLEGESTAPLHVDAAKPPMSHSRPDSHGLPHNAHDFGSLEREAVLTDLAGQVLGRHSPTDLHNLDHLVQLINRTDEPRVVPSRDEFEASIRQALGMPEHTPVRPEDVRSLTEPLATYLNQTPDRWLPSNVEELRNYADFLGNPYHDMTQDRVRPLLRQIAATADLPPQDAGRFEPVLKRLMDLHRNQNDHALDAPLGVSDFEDFAHQLIDPHRVEPMPDGPTAARTLLDAAHTLEIYGLREQTANRIEYRVMLGEMARLMELNRPAHSVTTAPNDGRRFVRGLEDFAQRITGSRVRMTYSCIIGQCETACRIVRSPAMTSKLGHRRKHIPISPKISTPPNMPSEIMAIE
ncbi:hypothetical protein IU470_27575 [Nocardia abscessus]|uniref:DUF222 domain-containing protein n=1 Tax=Nocardia abscessus TaxID=120957 RepID=A0ABS0CG58_9NOCA|nr:hypothetical protein [Nocardia abscessus]MBF6228845.1 hypothetical protein [Nocardia abscessus]